WYVGSELLYVRFIAQAHEHSSLSVGDLGRRADLSKSKTRQRALRQCIWRDLGGRLISQELDLCRKKSQPNRITIRGNIRGNIRDDFKNRANRKVLCLEQIRVRAWRLRRP